MATLTSNVSATARLFLISGDASAARLGKPYRVDDEVVTLRSFQRLDAKGHPSHVGIPNPNRWIVTRGDAGTHRATHSGGAEVVGVEEAVLTGVTLAQPDPFADGSEVQTVLTLTTTLDDTQIKAFNVTRQDIVPDPGAGKFIDFIRMYIRSEIADPDFENGYTNVSADNSTLILYSNNVEIGYVFNNNGFASGILSDLFSASSVVTVSPGLDPDITPLNHPLTTQPLGVWGLDDISGPLQIRLSQAGGALTGGHVDNKLHITVLYTVVDLNP